MMVWKLIFTLSAGYLLVLCWVVYEFRHTVSYEPVERRIPRRCTAKRFCISRRRKCNAGKKRV